LKAGLGGSVGAGVVEAVGGVVGAGWVCAGGVDLEVVVELAFADSVCLLLVPAVLFAAEGVFWGSASAASGAVVSVAVVSSWDVEASAVTDVTSLISLGVSETGDDGFPQAASKSRAQSRRVYDNFFSMIFTFTIFHPAIATRRIM
jgi:hypothetical protein